MRSYRGAKGKVMGWILISTVPEKSHIWKNPKMPLRLLYSQPSLWKVSPSFSSTESVPDAQERKPNVHNRRSRWETDQVQNNPFRPEVTNLLPATNTPTALPASSCNLE